MEIYINQNSLMEVAKANSSKDYVAWLEENCSKADKISFAVQTEFSDEEVDIIKAIKPRYISRDTNPDTSNMIDLWSDKPDIGLNGTYVSTEYEMGALDAVMFPFVQTGDLIYVEHIWNSEVQL